MHSYLKQQADLNWYNDEVQQAMEQVLRFWLDRGVDGFRVDAIAKVYKDHRFRDNPPNPDYAGNQPPHARLRPAYSQDQSQVKDFVRWLGGIANEYGEHF